MSSSRRGGLRSGTNREKCRTVEQLRAEAAKLGVEGRSTMRKAELERAVERKKR
jgi:Rho termination factor, N-terminal domain